MTSEGSYFGSIKNSDKEAFEACFKLYYAQLCHYAYSFLKEQEGSEEIVQEMFFKIWEKRLTLKVSTSEKGYLFSSIRNSCLNQIKHINIKETYKEHNQREIELDEQVDNDYAVQNELSVKIAETISSMPEARQEIFRMSREEGLKYREIAEKLNLSIKTVESQMGKALKYMREELSDYLVLIILIYLFLN